LTWATDTDVRGEILDGHRQEAARERPVSALCNPQGWNFGLSERLRRDGSVRGGGVAFPLGSLTGRLLVRPRWSPWAPATPGTWQPTAWADASALAASSPRPPDKLNTLPRTRGGPASSGQPRQQALEPAGRSLQERPAPLRATPTRLTESHTLRRREADPQASSTKGYRPAELDRCRSSPQVSPPTTATTAGTLRHLAVPCMPSWRPAASRNDASVGAGVRQRSLRPTKQRFPAKVMLQSLGPLSPT